MEKELNDQILRRAISVMQQALKDDEVFVRSYIESTGRIRIIKGLSTTITLEFIIGAEFLRELDK